MERFNNFEDPEQNKFRDNYDVPRPVEDDNKLENPEYDNSNKDDERYSPEDFDRMKLDNSDDNYDMSENKNVESQPEHKLENLDDEYAGLSDKQRERLSELNEGKDNLMNFYNNQLNEIDDKGMSTGDKLDYLRNMKSDAEDFQDYYNDTKNDILENPDDNPTKKYVLKPS